MQENCLDKLEDVYVYLGEFKEQINVILQDYLVNDVKNIDITDLQLCYNSIKSHLNVLFRALICEHKELEKFIENI